MLLASADEAKGRPAPGKRAGQVRPPDRPSEDAHNIDGTLHKEHQCATTVRANNDARVADSRAELARDRGNQS